MARRPEKSEQRMSHSSATGQAGGAYGNTESSMERCSELEAALEVLKAHYEQYFVGLVRLPPREEHDAVRGAIGRLRQASSRNTSVRFRAQSLQNRLLSYERMWQRVCREIEDGTWRRDLYKARLRAAIPARVEPRRPGQDDKSLAAAGGSDPAAGEGSKGVGDGPPMAAAGSAGGEGAVTGALRDDGRSSWETAGAVGGSRPQAGRGPSKAGGSVVDRRGGSSSVGPVRASGADLSDDRLRPLYDAFVMAKRNCRESTEGLSYESLASSLRKQVPALLEKHGASSVELKIVIKDGKAAVRAVPR